jgi:hypothetical protein
MNTRRLTVKELINELNQFNPDAFIVTDNFDDEVELDLSWTNKNGGDYDGPRDIAEEKREATHVSIEFIVNSNCSDNYKNIEK